MSDWLRRNKYIVLAWAMVLCFAIPALWWLSVEGAVIGGICLAGFYLVILLTDHLKGEETHGETEKLLE